MRAATDSLFDSYVVPNYGRLPMEPESGEGVWLWDSSGRRYLDFACGIAVCSLGHCPPCVSGVLEEQGRKLVHCSNLYRIREQALLAQVLTEKVLGIQGKCFFCNSGAESNEAMIKLSRLFGREVPTSAGNPRHEIITFTNSFHGRTMCGISATGQDRMKQGFEPLLPGFRHLPFNDPVSLREAVRPETVAILLEPVQGEGGINVATPEFLQTIAELRDQHSLLLLVDEVQSGLGRTGDLCAWRTICGSSVEIVPDAVGWAKGLGGGFPIGAVWVRDIPVGEKNLSTLLEPGTHGTTYGGSPLASSVGLAILEEIVGKGLAANASVQGSYIQEQVATWELPALSRLRGIGLMLGFLLDEDVVSKAPGFAESGLLPAVFIVRELMGKGLLTVPAAGGVVRWLPPLNVTREEVDEALAIMRGVLAEIST